MAKNTTPRSGSPARVRLVVLDAEIPDGDFGALASVLQNALRTNSPTIIQRVTTTNGTKALSHDPAHEADANETAEFEETEAEEVVERAPRPRAPKKAPKAPDVVEINMNDDVSFATYVADKKCDSVQKKYLTAAAWLHEHRNTPAVTDGHIYTCFRSIGWSTNLSDFSQPLRDLKGRRFFTTPERGHYQINHLGLDYVKKLGGNNGAG